jgi:chromate reductase
MPATFQVAVLVGSLRRESWNKKAAKAMVELAPKHVQFSFLQIGDLPPYNQDAEGAHAPELWTMFRAQVRDADAVLFATPEYNRSVPGVLKNAIDIGSRPPGANAFAKKPGAVMSASTGAIGGFGASHHLRQMAVFLDIPMLQQPEVYLGHADKLFDAQGVLVNEDVRKLLEKFGKAFVAWIELNAAK